MAEEDAEHLNRIRSQPCVVCAAIPPSHPHHHTRGLDEPCPCGASHKPKGQAQRRGKGSRAHDHDAIPLCWRHHRQLHELVGFFAGWDGQRLRAWQDQYVRELRAALLDPEGF